MTGIASIKGSYVLDPSHSQVGFVARHAMVTKVRGTFNGVVGTAVIDGENPSASTLEVIVDAATVDTRDKNRDAHLASPDFFDVDKYPQITFVGKDFAIEGDVVEVTGDLTIKDTTRELTIPFEFQGAATDPFGNERIGFEGSVVVNRKDFGLTWNAALEAGGVLVSEKIPLEFEVSAIKQA